MQFQNVVTGVLKRATISKSCSSIIKFNTTGDFWYSCHHPASTAPTINPKTSQMQLLHVKLVNIKCDRGNIWLFSQSGRRSLKDVSNETDTPSPDRQQFKYQICWLRRHRWQHWSEQTTNLSNQCGTERDADGPGVTADRNSCLAANVRRLNRKRYEAVILSDVTLEDVRAWTEDAFESVAVHLDALEYSTGDDGRRSRPVEQKGDLACNERVHHSQVKCIERILDSIINKNYAVKY